MSEAKPVQFLTQVIQERRVGPSYTETTYRILAEDDPTGFTLTERTDGPPEYRYTQVEVRGNGEVLDLLADDSPDPVEWILARLTPAAEVPHA